MVMDAPMADATVPGEGNGEAPNPTPQELFLNIVPQQSALKQSLGLTLSFVVGPNFQFCRHGPGCMASPSGFAESEHLF